MKTEALLFTGERGLLARRTQMCGFCRKRTNGFADMDADGYLDRLYVHKDYQGRGVAAAQANKKGGKPRVPAKAGRRGFPLCFCSFARPAQRGKPALRRKTICYDFARFSLSA